MRYLAAACLLLFTLVHTAHAEPLEFQQVRSATAKITYGEVTFLIDPMLAKRGAYDGFRGFHNDHLRNPLIDLPMSIEAVLADVDAVIVTHTHSDHWDSVAQQQIPKDMPIFVQNEADANKLAAQGFTQIERLEGTVTFQGVELRKIGGQHGTDLLYAMPALARGLGEVMGVIFSTANAPTLYLAGDTIWRPEVTAAITTFEPQVIVLNTGAGKLQGFADNPILMGKEDTAVAAQLAPNAAIVAVHMDALHHMTVTRDDLRHYIIERELTHRILVPDDGERLRFGDSLE
ncbi:MBL fold metallo-hydrolase [Pseudidiomarina salilacus]|uniref:MBL fold metallo-hydrolase n=1 Tax=Pseudidiomarina salilacus TaxID=3384452 RepID=UPI003984B2A2